MDKKRLVQLISLIINPIFLSGLIISYIKIDANKYLSQRLFNLATITAAGILNRMILISLLIVSLIIGVRLFWRIYARRFIFIEINLNKPFLLKIAGCLLLFVILLILSTKAISLIKRKAFIYDHILLIDILIILFIFLLTLQIKKAGISPICQIIKKSLLLIFYPVASWVFLFIFIIVNLLAFYHNQLRKPDGPNVIVIVSDALRADHLGCYGYNRDTSPNIDRFASESLLFESAWANSSWTKPSVGSIFTSLLPHQHRALYWSSILERTKMTMAEVLKNLGYRTYGIQANPVLSKAYGYDQGFDYYKQIDFARAEKITQEFLRSVKYNRRRPFFAYLHYYDTHVPYDAPEVFGEKFGVNSHQLFKPGKFKTIEVRLLNLLGLPDEDKKSLINLYDAAINYVDYNFKFVLDSLAEAGILDKTIIVFTSDHGEEFWEHGNFDHGHTLYEELLRVPLIIGWPGKIRAERIKSKVQLIDLLPIIIQSSGISLKKNNTVKLNLAEIISNKREDIFAEGILLGDYKRAIINNNWKLIENSGYINQDTLGLYGDLTRYVIPKYHFSYELYNLGNDPDEKNNLIEKENEEFIKLRAKMRRYRVTLEGPNKKIEIDRNKKLEDLRSLGYIH